MIRESLNQLIDVATSDYHNDSIIEAKNEYQAVAGKIYEDDKSYDNRMALFLEWYIFDRIFPDTNQTLLETLKDKNKENRSSNSLSIIDIFATNILGLFVVKRISGHSVKVLNLFDNKVYEANETMGKLIFSKNGVIEGRLIYHNDMYYFTGSFCFHPEKAKSFIKREVKQVGVFINKKKKELQGKMTQLANEKKKLHKVLSKIDTLKGKFLKSYSEAKFSKVKKNLTELETKLSGMKENLFAIENQVKILSSEKTTFSPKSLQINLIQKLSCMQLVWERSRLIDLDDIYHN